MTKLEEHLRYRVEEARLTQAYGYAPARERDACGVGLIAALDGQARRDVVVAGIEALQAVWHRGAVGADGKTGDGAGIHICIPDAFFTEQIERTGHRKREGHLGIGMVFLPRTDFAAQEKCRTIIESELLKFDYFIYGWRQVPVNAKVIGEKANDTRPEIEQIMFDTGTEKSQEEIERDLYLVRRRIERRAAARGIADLYLCSLSTRSLIYKGMFLAEQLSVFYPDLKDERFVSPMAIYHQRYSTNTFPTWRLAQPFRMLAHNGEINTLKGNMNWMTARERRLALDVTDAAHAEDILPVIQEGSSDSAALDAAFELLVRGGSEAPLAKTMLIPEAWSKRASAIPAAHRDMYAISNSQMEPWDGPAAIAAFDGRWAIAGLDRSGLRPLRYLVTEDDRLIVGSECGMCVIDERAIVEKGRLGPGQMVGVDLRARQLFHDGELKDKLSTERPYARAAKQVVRLDERIDDRPEPRLFDKDGLRRRQLAAGMTHEDMEMVLHPMVAEGKEATGSMGDDTPLAVLSSQYRPLSHFFRQNFSQVTNPPIDPLREYRVMSLKTRFPTFGNLTVDDPMNAQYFTLDSPVLTNAMFDGMREQLADSAVEIDCTFPVAPGEGSLRDAIDRIRGQVREAMDARCGHLILTDEAQGPARAAVPMILATAAVQRTLVEEGYRTATTVNVRSSECLDAHYFAVLIGVGATTVNPYLALDCLADRHAKGLFGDIALTEAVRRYKAAIEAGLAKILAKMGISVISSYRGGCNFEAVGLSRALVSEFFPGMPSRISGIGLPGIERKIRALHEKSFRPGATPLPIGGLYRYRHGAEKHANEATLIHRLQDSVTRNDYSAYKSFAEETRTDKPLFLRDLLDFKKPETGLPLEAVEAVQEIRKRFVTPGMSLGALSPEAHGTLNIAMNRIGAKSVSGEGGEDPDRYKPLPNGDNKDSAVKQVASGRFGVTAEYLNHAREIEIKVAQGAKPGEGGQLPGFKVTEMIAKYRHSTPGVGLISPPPHHDIYSIEDLAQLIYDLKQINPLARVCVKLVAASGIGTIAAGVAKAKADVILISGHVGGTGASPLTSIKYAGIPWEMGLAEANQVLTLNGLRHRVRLRADGGIRTGRDIVVAAMLGAEEFGIGTASLVAMGCLMVRQCHSNTCPVGICTQDEDLRGRFGGTPEKVINLFTFIAQEVREILSGLGLKSLDEVVGRTDLLSQVSRGASHLDDLDLNPLLVQVDPGANSRTCTVETRNEVNDTLDKQIVEDAAPCLETGQRMQLTYAVRNTHRAVGARTSSHIVRRFGMTGLRPGRLTVELRGSAGQSLGAFGVQGLKLVVLGEANDYVGKGLSGATIVVRPAPESALESHRNAIVGNTVLYGATSGKLFAAGLAGERFAVRNSGAETVVEGVGANGCEYMTGGTAVVLGPVGDNFAAGMTGGMAFVYDKDETFEEVVNPDSVIYCRLASSFWEGRLRSLIEEHAEETGSLHAQALLSRWDAERSKFWVVCPKEMLDKLPQPLTAENAVPAAQ